MAAAARSPAPADGRLPCPLCGGLIHPIAGRCKHCKGDLSALRSERPAAAASLPPLASVKAAASMTPASVAAAAYSGGSYSPYQRGPASAASPIQQAGPRLVVSPAGAAPVDHMMILPPRPTGRMQAHGTRSTMRSWPMIVIIVAAVAIVVAVVIMLLPPAKKSDAGAPAAHNSNALEMPAPDRMPLDPNAVTPTPTPNPTAPNPNGNGFTPPPAPVPPTPTPPPSDPDDTTQIDPPPDIDDPDFLGKNPPSPHDLGGGVMGGGSPGTAMLAAMLGHACTRVAHCPQVDANVQLLCQSVPTIASSAGPVPTCAAAQRCIQQIDTMSCTSLTDTSSMSTSFFMSALTGAQDCMTAMQC